MRNHKDLPPGSQAWANDLDTALAELKVLREVVKRLAGNAGLDFANPQRGLASGNIPSVVNPVGQKLSSLADVGTYNVADKQVLSWSQQGQKWLPATLPSASGTIDISSVSYSQLPTGYGVVTGPTEYAYTAAGFTPNEFGPDHYYTEIWSTGSAYYGSGDFNTGTGYSLVELSPGDGFGRPYVQISASDYVDGSDAYLTIASYQIRINGATFEPMVVTTATRPTIPTDTREGAMVYDDTLGIPIFWNGTTWTNALGTAV